jgi:hypothetical protein
MLWKLLALIFILFCAAVACGILLTILNDIYIFVEPVVTPLLK